MDAAAVSSRVAASSPLSHVLSGSQEDEAQSNTTPNSHASTKPTTTPLSLNAAPSEGKGTRAARPAPSLIFSKTPTPPASSAKSNGRKNLKRRPPTPGGPAVGRTLRDVARAKERERPALPLRSFSLRGGGAIASSSSISPPLSTPASQTSSPPSTTAPAAASLSDTSLPGSPGSRSAGSSSARPSISEYTRAPSALSQRESDRRLEIELALMSSVFSVSSFGMMGVSSAAPPSRNDLRAALRPVSPPPPTVHHSSDTATQSATMVDPPRSHATTTSPHLLRRPPAKVSPNDMIPTIRIPEKHLRSASTCSTIPDSPSTKALMDRLLAAPDYPGFGDSHEGTAEGEEGEETYSNDESDGSGSIRFASTAARRRLRLSLPFDDDDEHDGYGNVDPGVNNGNGSPVTAAAARRVRVRGQRVGGGGVDGGGRSTKVRRLLGTMSDDEFAAARPRYGSLGGGGSRSDVESGGESSELQSPFVARARTGIPPSSPLSPKSSRPIRPPPSSPPQVGARVFALDALQADYGTIKRSHSASVVRPPRIPQLLDTTGPVEAPLPSPSFSSSANSLSTNAVDTSGRKATRRRSAMFWVKEYTGLISSGSTKSPPTDDATAVTINTGTLSVAPPQNHPLSNPLSPRSRQRHVGSREAVATTLDPPPTPLLPSVVHSPFASSFTDRFGVPSSLNNSDQGHFNAAGSREDLMMGGGVGGSMRSHKNSIDTAYHSSLSCNTSAHGHGLGAVIAPAVKSEGGKEDEDEEKDVSPYYTVVGSSSDHRLPAGYEDRWGPAPSQWDTSITTRVRGATVVVGGAPASSSKGQRLFGFSLKRAASKKAVDSKSKAPGFGNRPRGKTIAGAQVHCLPLGNGGAIPEPPLEDRTVRPKVLEKARKRRSYSVSLDHHTPWEMGGVAAHRAHRKECGDASTARKNTAGAGQELWRRMKRIGSNGALRDTYRGGAATSVCSPRSGHSTPGTRLPSDVDGVEAVSQLLASSGKGSTSDLDSPGPASKPTTPSRSISSSRLKYSASFKSTGSHTVSPSHSLPQTRASTPGLDHPSPQFGVQRSQSARATVSSVQGYRGKPAPPPPLPQSPVFDSLSSPYSDRGHLSDGTTGTRYYRAGQKTVNGKHSTRSSPKSRTTSNISPTTAQESSPRGEFHSLPIPPRRAKRSNLMPPAVPDATNSSAEDGLFKPDLSDNDDGYSEDPEIPEFSVHNAINAFTPRRPPGGTLKLSPTEAFPPPLPQPLPPVIPVLASTGGRLPTPPRPMRDVRRPPPMPVETKELDGGEESYGPRPLTSTFGPTSTMLLRRTREPSDLPGSNSQPCTTTNSLTLGQGVGNEPSASPRALTDREKAAKWGALLEKSALAGGTLHLKVGPDTITVEPMHA